MVTEDFLQQCILYKAESLSLSKSANFLRVLHEDSPHIDAHCVEITGRLIGVTPDRMAMLVDSRKILLDIVAQANNTCDGEQMPLEAHLVTLGLHTMIESRVNPDEEFRASLKSHYSSLLRDRGLPRRAELSLLSRNANGKLPADQR